MESRKYIESPNGAWTTRLEGEDEWEEHRGNTI